MLCFRLGHIVFFPATRLKKGTRCLLRMRLTIMSSKDGEAKESFPLRAVRQPGSSLQNCRLNRKEKFRQQEGLLAIAEVMFECI